MKWTQKEINEVYAKIQHQAAADEEFRKELLNDPNAVIEKVSGLNLPEGFKVKVIENDPKYAATFVLPPMNSGEIDDDELSDIAGGVCGLEGDCAANVCGGEFETCVGQLSK